MDKQNLDALQVRLSVVERKIRLVFVGGLFSLIILVLFGVAVQHVSSQATIIQAHEIQLVDANGKERIHMVAETSTGDTFNGRFFDAPYLMLRSAILGVEPSRNLVPYRYSFREHCDLEGYVI